MRKIIPYFIALMLIFTGCGTDYDMNGTYVSENEDMSFSIVILDDFCRFDVIKTNDDGKTAIVAFDGAVTKKNDIAVISINEEAGVDGNMFEFVYNDRKRTLTDTNDNIVFEKTKPESILPTGSYTASFDDNSYELVFDEDRCSLTFMSSANEGQTSVIYDKATVKANGNIITMRFEGNTMGDEDIQTFIFGSDILMDTSDGKIFNKILED